MKFGGFGNYNLKIPVSPEVIIFLSGVILVIASSSLGSFLVLQRMSMMTDAIAHGILPGVVSAYFFSHEYNFFLVVFFSLLSSFFVGGFVSFLTDKIGIKKDAAIGITFATSFSLGIILISEFFKNIHVDTSCVLYGEIEYASFEFFFLGDANLGPLSFWVMGGIMLINLLFVGIFWKEISLFSFDQSMAYMQKFSPVLLQTIFFALLSVTAVGALSLVGIILFISFVIVPPATARLFCTSRVQSIFKPSIFNMLIFSFLFGILGVGSGIFLGMILDTSLSGSMAIMNGVIFSIVFVLFLLCPQKLLQNLHKSFFKPLG